jgi:hypothetical protein
VVNYFVSAVETKKPVSFCATLSLIQVGVAALNSEGLLTRTGRDLIPS